MSYKDALDYLKSRRPVCQPNEGFVRQLLEYEKILTSFFGWTEKEDTSKNKMHDLQPQSADTNTDKLICDTKQENQFVRPQLEKQTTSDKLMTLLDQQQLQLAQLKQQLDANPSLTEQDPLRQQYQLLLQLQQQTQTQQQTLKQINLTPEQQRKLQQMIQEDIAPMSK